MINNVDSENSYSWGTTILACVASAALLSLTCGVKSCFMRIFHNVDQDVDDFKEAISEQDSVAGFNDLFDDANPILTPDRHHRQMQDLMENAVDHDHVEALDMIFEDGYDGDGKRAELDKLMQRAWAGGHYAAYDYLSEKKPRFCVII